MTVNATWPGLRCFSPSLREINLQEGGKIEETRTMLHAAMPALRKASSKLDRRSRCFPTPLVRKMFFATNAMSLAGERCLLLCQPTSTEKNSARKLTSVRSDVNCFRVRRKLQLCERMGEFCDLVFCAEQDAGSERIG